MMDSDQLLRLSDQQLEWSPLTCLQLSHIDRAWRHPSQWLLHVSARGGLVLQLQFSERDGFEAWCTGLQALLSLQGAEHVLGTVLWGGAIVICSHVLFTFASRRCYCDQGPETRTPAAKWLGR